jgi:hypothetical protein
MGANREWRAAHPTSRPVRGYEMRYRTTEDHWTQRKHAWGIDGELPEEWTETKSDPEVVEANIFRLSGKERGIWRREALLAVYSTLFAG